MDIDDLVHKSDLNSYLTKDNINKLSDENEKNLLLTKNDILNLPDEEEEELKLIIKKDVLNTLIPADIGLYNNLPASNKDESFT
jgi:hypothetical protein